MNETFQKFKKRAWQHVVIVCVLSALAAAVIAVNAVFVPCRLCGVRLSAVWYVLIAIGGLAAGGAISFALLRIDNAKVAKRLDAELQLCERVQTALCYSGQEGDMLQQQRDDAAKKLSERPVKALPFKYTAVAVVLAAVLVLGVGALPVTAVCTSAAAPVTAPPEDPPRPVTDWEWAALDELIEYVKASQKADATVKAGMTKALEGLRNVLQGGVSQSSLTNFVQNTVTQIRNTVRDANDRADVSEEQRARNSEEESYVVNKLYEIFSIQVPGGEQNPDGSDDPEKPDDGDDDPSSGGNTGSGELIVNGVPFFDPEKGYVPCGEARAAYKEIVDKALQEGTISRKEWELIMETYFADMSDKEQ